MTQSDDTLCVRFWRVARYAASSRAGSSLPAWPLSQALQEKRERAGCTPACQIPICKLARTRPGLSLGTLPHTFASSDVIVSVCTAGGSIGHAWMSVQAAEARFRRRAAGCDGRGSIAFVRCCSPTWGRIIHSCCAATEERERFAPSLGQRCAPQAWPHFARQQAADRGGTGPTG